MAGPDRPRPCSIRSRTICEKYQKDYFIIVDMSSTLIEAAYAHLVGTQNFFLLLYDEPELIAGVLDGLTEYYTELGANAVTLGVDMIRVGDDVGAQQAMMLSPKRGASSRRPRFSDMFNAGSARRIPSSSSSCTPAATTRRSCPTRSTSACICRG